MSRLQPWAGYACAALAVTLGCSSQGTGPISAAPNAGASHESIAGAAGTAGHAGQAGTSSPTGSGGISDPSRSDASVVDPTAASSGGAGGGISTGEVTAPVGDACLGSIADTTRHSAHCGACGNACAPFVLASGLDWPIGIALNATTAFWITTGSEAQVMSAPLAGGPAVILADSLPSPMTIAIDATHVYWAAGNIFKVPLAGGTPEPLLTTQVNAYSIALDRDFVYWVEQVDNTVGKVAKVALEGGEPITLAMVPFSAPFAIAVDSANAYWANGSNANDSVVMKVALTGGEPIALASGASNAYSIGLDATHVYWVAHDSIGSFLGPSIAAVVMKAPIDGGAATTLATGTHMPQSLAVDRVSAYWTSSSTSQVASSIPGSDGIVQSVPIGGGSIVTLGSNQDEPAAIASNRETVCWTTIGNGAGTGSVKCLARCSEGSCF